MDIKVLREAQGLIGQAITLVEAIKEDVDETYEEGSAEWQESVAGQRAAEQAVELELALENLNSADSELEAAMKD